MQAVGVALHDHRVTLQQPQVDAPRLRLRQYGGDAVAHQGLQIHRGGGVGLAALCLLARQHQHLFDQRDRTVDALVQTLHRQVSAGFVAAQVGAAQCLGLQAQGGQGRTQLMGGVGNKTFLRVEGTLHAVEQQVQLLHQGPHLIGQALCIQWRQVVGRTASHLATHALHRSEGAANHPGHRQHQQRCHQRQRPGGAPGHGTGAGLAGVHVLRDLDSLEAGLH